MKRVYPGLGEDDNGGLTPMGKIVLDARVFELVPEEEECRGWDQGRMQMLYDQVHAAWEPYGHLPSRLPEPLRERHQRIYREAVERAQAAGWSPEGEYSE